MNKSGTRVVAILCILSTLTAAILAVLSLVSEKMRVPLSPGTWYSIYLQLAAILCAAAAVYLSLIGYYLAALRRTAINKILLVFAGFTVLAIFVAVVYSVLISDDGDYPKLETPKTSFLILTTVFPLLASISAIASNEVSRFKQLAPLVCAALFLVLRVSLTFILGFFIPTDFGSGSSAALFSVVWGILGGLILFETKSREAV